MLLRLPLLLACFSPREIGPARTFDPKPEDEEEDTAVDTAVPDTADTADDTSAADPGAVVYTDNCASCHGEDGRLGVGGAKDLNEEVPDKTDEEIAAIVREGKGDMPPVALDDTQLADLLVHLRATFGGPPAE